MNKEALRAAQKQFPSVQGIVDRLLREEPI